MSPRVDSSPCSPEWCVTPHGQAWLDGAICDSPDSMHSTESVPPTTQHDSFFTHVNDATNITNPPATGSLSRPSRGQPYPVLSSPWSVENMLSSPHLEYGYGTVYYDSAASQQAQISAEGPTSAIGPSIRSPSKPVEQPVWWSQVGVMSFDHYRASSRLKRHQKTAHTLHGNGRPAQVFPLKIPPWTK